MEPTMPTRPAYQANLPTRTSKMEVGDLILALCEAGEWDLALRMARDLEQEREK